MTNAYANNARMNSMSTRQDVRMTCTQNDVHPTPRSPALPRTPCVEGRQRTAPHSSSFPPTTAPFQTMHLDVWGPSPVLGPRQERYFMIVVDDYSLYTTVFSLQWKADFFSSHDVTFDESVDYYRSRPHQGTEVFSPPLFLTLEPPPVAPIAPPPSRLAPSGVSHVTPQSSPPERPVLVVSGGARGTVAEGEGTDALLAGGVGSEGAGVMGVEVTPVEDTAPSCRLHRPASPPGFPSVPQSPPRSSQQRVQLQSQQERVEEESWPHQEMVEQESRPQ
ncbi:unnamed protein product [Closterium sp. NIES-54]